MKKLYILICLTIVYTAAFSQKTSVIDNAGVGIKTFNARQAFLAGDIKKALKLYTEANASKPNDASILFHLGQCYNALDKPIEALSYLQKAESMDTNANEDLHLDLGMAYLQDDQLDNGLKEFMWHKKKYTSNPQKQRDDEIDHFIGECILAKQLEAHPLNVNVKKAGEAINSEFEEKTPSVTADGTRLIFTSNRPLLVGDMKAPKDSRDPGELYDNVYMCNWDSAKNDWGLAYPIDNVNEPYAHTSCTSISPDGIYVFLYKNDLHGPSIGGDIYYSKLSKSGKYGAPVSIGKPVNTSYYEDGACLSPDGNTLYFVSERPGGYGGGDIYKSDKLGKNKWSDPENLGPVVNSVYDEGAPFMAADGNTLFFSSDGHNTMGGYDIFKTSMNDSGKWSVPANLGYPINTVNNEKGFSLSADSRTAYISSDRKGGEGKRDIYIVDLSSYSVLSKDSANVKPKGYSILRGKVMDEKGAVEGAQVIVSDTTGEKIATMTTIADGMYFITLKGHARYKIKVSNKGDKPSSKNIMLPDSPLGTFTMQQDFTLDKE